VIFPTIFVVFGSIFSNNYSFKIMKLLTVFLFAMFLQTCTESVAPNETVIQGEWVLKNVFFGDAIDTPCNWEAGDKVQEMTLNITTEKANESDMYLLNGQSAVNRFFGSYSITSFDTKTQIGTIKMGGISGTKMAGPTELMNCEYRYYTLMGDAVDFRITTDGTTQQLHLGRLKKDDAPSRDGGTYLIFERKK
jgi:heat shock protein HslJ